MFRKMRSREGFTLVELLVVIIIIGILAAIGFARLGQVTKSANIRADEADIRSLTSAVQMWAMEDAKTPEQKLGIDPDDPTDTIDLQAAVNANAEIMDYVEFTINSSDDDPFPRVMDISNVTWVNGRWDWGGEEKNGE